MCVLNTHCCIFAKEDTFEELEDPPASSELVSPSVPLTTSSEAEGQPPEDSIDLNSPLDSSAVVAGTEAVADDDESHLPPIEGGLAGLEEDEEDDYEDDDRERGEDERGERGISPVTWDVDINANPDDDNLSVGPL